jgi:transcription antitermination factor NusG
MPDRQINELKMLMTSSVELEITAEGLQPGEKVVVKAGPLKGLSGEIISYRSQKLLVMRLNNLGYSIIINVATTLLNRV